MSITSVRPSARDGPSCDGDTRYTASVFKRVARILGFGGGAERAPSDLPFADRETVRSFLTSDHGLPHVDWGAADAWVERTEPDPARHDRARRGVAAAWLDELRDALREDHRRWRGVAVEGLAPLDGNLSAGVRDVTDRSLKVIHTSLSHLWGGDPIPPVGVIALASKEDYYSFVSHYYPDEGSWGTSGGMYIRDTFPILVLPLQVRHAYPETIAHEMTHHALKMLDLPIWAEEGLTQVMEERVTGRTSFVFDREKRERHRELWSEVGLGRFWTGDAYHSAEENEQELAYNLSQVMVRTLLADHPKRFMAFAKAARSSDLGAAAARMHLGVSLPELAARSLGDGDW